VEPLIRLMIRGLRGRQRDIEASILTYPYGMPPPIKEKIR